MFYVTIWFSAEAHKQGVRQTGPLFCPVLVVYGLVQLLQLEISCCMMILAYGKEFFYRMWQRTLLSKKSYCINILSIKVTFLLPFFILVTNN